MNIKRSEIWLANLSPTLGSEINKTRPVVVVSNDTNNKHNNVISIIPITSNIDKLFSFEVFIPKNEANLPKIQKQKLTRLERLIKSD